jgi:ribosomal protein S18 acetylase RimI-like enzyme
MEPKIMYRRFEKNDIPDLVNIMIKNWKFDQLLSNKNAYRLGHAFLYYGLANGEFTKVAEVNGEVVGIIIGNLNEHPLRRKEYLFRAFIHVLPMLFSKEGMDILKLYRTTVSTNNKMFKQLQEEFDGEVALFAVAEQAQGLGIGSSLFHSFLHYLKKNQANTFFLFTDTSCNYGFYEHKQLKRIAQESQAIKEPMNKEMEFFIYKGIREELEKK